MRSYLKVLAKAPEITGILVEFSTWAWRPKRENVVFVTKGLFNSEEPAYNPLIAEERGAKRRRTWKQATEKQEQFWFSGFEFRIKTKSEIRVLTDENVSITTRHVDDAER